MKPDHGNPARRRRRAAAVLACMVLLGTGVRAAPAQVPVVTPRPTVPEVFTLMGQFVRVAYNDKGFVTLGYQVAQRSIGDEWMMLEVGVTVRKPVTSYKLKREHFTLKTPDGAVVPLAKQSEYGAAGYLPILHQKAKVVNDSINYFPADVSRGCPLSFFANMDRGRGNLAFDEVELSPNRACVGRLYFKVPGGIKVGQYWLNVDFGDSEVQVPFRILTKEEEKQFRDSWEDLKKAHDESYKQ
jgi:hypothetical protein